ncbi:MAG: C40 family peptidase [Firmicutes bacterium]|nr:C40 family peptidase [Bacillota bacterium]
MSRGIFKKTLLVLCGIVVMGLMMPGLALALPMQPTVTVFGAGDGVVFQQNIRYKNTYTEPAVKSTVDPAPATKGTVTKETAIKGTATKNVSGERSAAPTTSRSGSDVRPVLKTAFDLLGKPYVYGSGGPNSFDCSGFTMYVFKQHGINLPHNAAAQFQAGIEISREELTAGDLVFFGFYGSGEIQHVGIYTEGGKFIHSSTNHGVIVSSLSDQYYASNYKGAARVIR